MKLLKYAQSTPYIPQDWGITPRPPAGSILHLFFSGLYNNISK
jgi:hypothetical protein